MRNCPSPYVLRLFPSLDTRTDTNGRETLTDDKKDNPAGVATPLDEVIYQSLRCHIKDPFLLPLSVETLNPCAR